MEGLFIPMGIIIGILILISPFFGLLATVSILSQGFIQAASMSLLGIFTMATPLKIIGGLTFVSAFIRHILEHKSWRFLRNPVEFSFLLFFGWLVIDGFAHPGFASRENFTTFTSVAFLGFVIFSLINSFKRYRLTLWTAVISVTVFSFVSVLQTAGRGTNRLSGLNYGPNEFAISLLPIIGIATSKTIIEKKLLRVLAIAALIIISFALLLTLSRGALIGFACMVILTLFKAKRKIRTFFILCLLVLILVKVAPPALWERFEKTRVEESYTGEESVVSTSRRYYLSKAAWDIFLAHPITGIGIGNYYYECSKYQPVVPGRAHNMYFEILAELGIVGFVLFIAVLVNAFRSLVQVIKNKGAYAPYANGLYIGLCGFLIAAIFLHAEQDKILWFTVFMAAILPGLALNRGEKINA